MNPRVPITCARIQLHTDSFVPHSGGSRIYYYHLYCNLVEIGPYEVDVITTQVNGWEGFDAAHSSSRLNIFRHGKPLPNWRYGQLPHMLPVIARAVRYCKIPRPDWFHSGDLFPQGLGGYTVRSLTRMPFLIYCHGDEVSQTNQRRFQPLVRNMIYRRADVIIAANEFARQHLLTIGIPESRIHKILPGVDTERIHPAPPRPDLVEKHKLSGKVVLLTLARLVPRKGIDLLLRALPCVLKRVPTLRYLIGGIGPLHDDLTQLVRDLGLQDVVEFIGKVPSDQVSDYYNLCDLFAMVNRSDSGGDIESFGMVFVEANGAGKPVLGGRSGGTGESIEEGVTGLIADPDSLDDISAKLLLLMENCSLRATLGRAGLARVQRDYSWRSRALQLDTILRQFPHL